MTNDELTIEAGSKSNTTTKLTIKRNNMKFIDSLGNEYNFTGTVS